MVETFKDILSCTKKEKLVFKNMTEISTFWLIHRKALYFQGQVLYFAEYVAIQHFSFRMLQNFEVISLNKKKNF